MHDSAEVYRQLQRRVDKLPVPFPESESGVELRLLRHLFSEEEAEIASRLSALSEPLGKIDRRLKNDGLIYVESELERLLDGLVDKGAIAGGTLKPGRKKVKGYSLMPLVVGMFEMQVDRLTADYVRDFDEYLDADFGKRVLNAGTGQLRTVPVARSVDTERGIGRYDDIARYVKMTRGPFAVMNCVCRQAKDLLEHACDHSEIRETCLTIGAAAIGMSRRGNARLVKREEFLDLLDRAEKRGFVIQPQNTQQPSYICCCCGDCCEVLKTAKKLPAPAEVFHTNYFAVVNESTCNGCKRCLGRCQMGAVSMREAGDREVAAIDLARCVGCGLCVTTCRAGSLELMPKGKPKAPPKTSTAMFSRIYFERLGLVRAGIVFAKALLRRKV